MSLSILPSILILIILVILLLIWQSQQTHYRRSMQRKKHPAFSLLQIAKEEMFRDILNLSVSKARQGTDIPSKIVKENADNFASTLHSSFNRSVINSEFPSVLKQDNITPVFKKGERYSTDNYRPVSILTNVSKIFEQWMFRKINEYMDVF